MKSGQFQRIALLLGLACFAHSGWSATDDESVVERSREAGRATGLAFHEIANSAWHTGKAVGRGAAELGREIGHGAADAGRQIGDAAVEVGRTVGEAATEGTKALVGGIKGEGSGAAPVSEASPAPEH
jgi:hypothetical protein